MVRPHEVRVRVGFGRRGRLRVDHGPRHLAPWMHRASTVHKASSASHPTSRVGGDNPTSLHNNRNSRQPVLTAGSCVRLAWPTEVECGREPRTQSAIDRGKMRGHIAACSSGTRARTSGTSSSSGIAFEDVLSVFANREERGAPGQAPAGPNASQHFGTVAPLSLEPAADQARDPVVLVELLSRSTGDRDRGAKWIAYGDLPSLERYVLINQHRRFVEVYSRTAEGWSLTLYAPPLELVPLPAIGGSKWTRSTPAAAASCACWLRPQRRATPALRRKEWQPWRSSTGSATSRTR
jgi:hypothetical protein